MIAVISPAKTMDFNSSTPLTGIHTPYFLKEANYLASKINKLTRVEFESILNISGKLANLNLERYAGWETAPVRQAIFAYNGDVYAGLSAKNLSSSELNYLQQHLRILSGMYGLLNPFDGIKPHRLEMGSHLPISHGKNLHGYWTKRITALLKPQIESSGSGILINLASQEYYSALNYKMLKNRIITPVFLDLVNGRYSVVSVFAKKARGMMCRFMAQHAIHDHDMLTGFDEEGYHFNHQLSKTDTWVFSRG